MNASHNLERLCQEILPLSVAKEFATARREWELVAVEVSTEFEHCPCGQRIKEHCFIRNRRNGNETHVGNVCVNRFMEIETGSLFDGLKRIAKDPTANANDDVIEYARKNGFLFGDREYGFLKDISRKRNLSEAQLAWKVKINRRILAKTMVQRRTGQTP